MRRTPISQNSQRGQETPKIPSPPLISIDERRTRAVSTSYFEVAILYESARWSFRMERETAPRCEGGPDL